MSWKVSSALGRPDGQAGRNDDYGLCLDRLSYTTVMTDGMYYSGLLICES